MVLKIAICEDEQIQADQIINVVNRFKDENQLEYSIDYFDNGLKLIEQNIDEYDLIILDILMNEISGLDIAQKIRRDNQHVKIIFITAHQQYWPEGYKVLASRYLLKPMSDDQLYEELVEVFDEIEKSRMFIMATKDKAMVKVRINEITYLEISGRKVLIHMKDEVYSSNHNLSYWYKILKFHHFSYTHSSYLVNMKYVNLVERDRVRLTTGNEVYMSLRKYKLFKMHFIRYISQV